MRRWARSLAPVHALTPSDDAHSHTQFEHPTRVGVSAGRLR
jgi:hypothetical protein